MMNNIIDRYATYTIVFKNLLDLDPGFIWGDLQLDTEEHTNKFRQMFIAIWGVYEIGGETIPQFKDFVKLRFDEYKDYYIEKINAYETQINMLDGMKETYSETITNDGTNNSAIIDLPNKQTTKEYISNKQNTKIDNTETRTYSRTGGINVIKLKEDYLKLLQNIFKEFVDKFDTCFIQIFS